MDPITTAGNLGRYALKPRFAGPVERSGADSVDFSQVASGFHSIQLRLDGEGRPQRVSSEGFNAPFHCHLDQGRRGVFKAIPNDSRFSQQAWEDEMAKEVVASKILKSFCPSGLVYQASECSRLGMVGVATEFFEMSSLARDLQAVKGISNPREAIEGGVVDAWMGNYDRIENDGNVWIERQQQKVVYGDYGCAFHPGVRVLGIPKVNARLFQALATPERVEPVLDKIRALSDQQIAGMVRLAGQDCPFLRPEVEDGIVAVLIKNRDELRAQNPFAEFYGGRRPVGRLEKPLAELLAQKLDDGQDSHLVSLRALSRVHGQVGQDGADLRRVQSTLALGLEATKSSLFCPLPIQVEDLVAWRGLLKNQLRPEEQQEQNLGFIIRQG